MITFDQTELRGLAHMSEPLLPNEPLPQRFARVLAWLAGAAILFGGAIPIAIEVFGRRFFNYTIHSFEISAYAFAISIGLGLAFTITQKSNIRVDILQGFLPTPLRLLCDLLSALSLAVCGAALAWYAWGTLAQSWRMGARSESILQVPMVLPQSVWWFGILCFAVMAVIVLAQASAALVRREIRYAETLVGSLRVHEEISQSGVEAPTGSSRP